LKSWKKEALIFAVCGLAVLLYVLHLRQSSPNLDDDKLREVQELSASLPVFPGFNQVATNSKSGYTSVDLTKYFYSNADYNDVKEFYFKILEKDGWVLSAEDTSEAKGRRELTFKKGQFSILIFHSNASSVYNYAIDFVWSDRY
jgi:hypothetical protein